MQKHKSTFALRASSTPLPANSLEPLVIAPNDGLKYPVRHEWSELQRSGRKAAECGNRRTQCNISSLRS